MAGTVAVRARLFKRERPLRFGVQSSRRSAPTFVSSLRAAAMKTAVAALLVVVLALGASARPLGVAADVARTDVASRP